MAEGDREVPDTTMELMSEIRDRINLLESALEPRVDAMVSPDSKLPFRVLIYRAGSARRMAELSRSAFENFEKDRLVSAILLTRASVETAAGLWYLSAKLDSAIKRKTVADIGKHLRRLLMGSRRDQNMPDPVNVLDFIDQVDRDLKGFREQYDELSEYAHPNWSGTSFLYSKPDPPNLWTNFGANIRGAKSARRTGVTNLSVALMFFERSYHRIADTLPIFIERCKTAASKAGVEDDAPSKGGGGERNGLKANSPSEESSKEKR